MIERARRVPPLTAAGTLAVVIGGAADLVLHATDQLNAARGGHVVVFAGMVVTLVGVLLEARHPRKEGR